MTDDAHHGNKLIEGLKKEMHKLANAEEHFGTSAQHLIEKAERLLPLLQDNIPWHAYDEKQVEDARHLAKELNIGAVNAFDEKK